MSEVPFYLLSNEEVTPTELGKFDVFDFTPLEQKYENSVSTSVFEGFGSSFNQVGDDVWDAVKGTWVSAKDLVNSGVASLGSAAGDIYSWVKSEIFIWVGGVLLVLWILVKSGILKEVGPIAAAAMKKG